MFAPAPAAEGATYRFRPGLAAFAWSILAIGALMLAAVPVLDLAGVTRTFAVVCGLAGVALALLYFRSPAWRLTVVVDAEALTVRRDEDVRFRLPWADVREVVASPSTRTCYVDGGAVSRSLLVPGPGAPAPYKIERRAELYAAIVARAPADRIREVATLETAKLKIV